MMTLTEIEEATALIRPFIAETPTRRWPALEGETGCELSLKHENLTPVGAFKIRGGLVYMNELKKTQPSIGGVIAASTGNHGQSVAFAARAHGLRAVIVVPHGNNAQKNAAMCNLGAELVEHEGDFQAALEHSRFLSTQQVLHAVPSWHPWLVRGVATYGLEMFRAIKPAPDVVFVPIGLGSGFCGVSAAREALGLVNTRLIGVVSEHAPAYAISFQQRRVIEHISTTQVAEGVACRVPHAEALEHILHHAHQIVTVSDAEVLAAMRLIRAATGETAEGAGALAYAAFLKQSAVWRGARVACVLSGGNVSSEVLKRLDG